MALQWQNILTDINMLETRCAQHTHTSLHWNFTFSHTEWNYQAEIAMQNNNQYTQHFEKKKRNYENRWYTEFGMCAWAPSLHYLSIDFASHDFFAFCIGAVDMMTMIVDYVNDNRTDMEFANETLHFIAISLSGSRTWADHRQHHQKLSMRIQFLFSSKTF